MQMSAMTTHKCAKMHLRPLFKEARRVSGILKAVTACSVTCAARQAMLPTLEI